MSKQRPRPVPANGLSDMGRVKGFAGREALVELMLGGAERRSRRHIRPDDVPSDADLGEANADLHVVVDGLPADKVGLERQSCLDLVHLVVGGTSDDEVISRHVATCPACGATFERLDRLMGAVLRARSVLHHFEESCEECEEIAAEIDLRPSEILRLARVGGMGRGGECVPDATIESFGLGTLGLAAATRVAQHLVNCGGCSGRFSSIAQDAEARRQTSIEAVVARAATVAAGR